MIKNKHFKNYSFLFFITIFFQSSNAFSVSGLNFAPEEGVSDSYKSACDTKTDYSAIGHSPLCEASTDPGSKYKKLVMGPNGAPNKIDIELGNKLNEYDNSGFEAWFIKSSNPAWKKSGSPEPCLAELFKTPEEGFGENWGLTRIGFCDKNKSVNDTKKKCTDDGGKWDSESTPITNYYTVIFDGNDSKSSCSIEQAKVFTNLGADKTLNEINQNTGIVYHTGKESNKIPSAPQQITIPVTFTDDKEPYLYYK